MGSRCHALRPACPFAAVVTEKPSDDSASSATTLLQGHGYGSGYLIKFAVYGAIGLVLMRVLARDGVAKVHSITAPLLVASFVLVLAVHVPHVGVSVNGARRWWPGARRASTICAS